MKVALVSDTFLPQVNGVARSVEQFASSLVTLGHEVRIYAVSKNASALDADIHNRYSVFTIPSVPALIYDGLRFTLPLGFSFRDLRSFSPDVIHVHTPFAAGWEAVHAAQRLSIPLIGTHHTFFDYYLKHVGLDFPSARRATWEYTVAFYNKCNVVTAPTQALISELLTHGLTRPIHIVPNAVDTGRFRPGSDAERDETRHMLGLTSPVILSLGRLSYEKSVDQIIRAFSVVAALQSDATLLIVGDGPERANLERLTKNLNLTERVRFTGFLRDATLASAIRVADVFASASKSENMPLSFLEVLASGVPIVAVGSLGVSEILHENADSFIVEPDCPDLLAQRLLMLLDDDALRVRFGQIARITSLHYAPDAVASQLVTIYEKARHRLTTHVSS